MQATVGTRRFGFGRFNTVAVKIAVVTGLAAAVATGATLSLNNTLDIGGGSSTVAPKAIYVERAGEGRLGTIHGATGQLKATTAELQGEGIGALDATTSRPRAAFAAGAGEGLVGAHLPLPGPAIKSYSVLGAGEGLIGSHLPVTQDAVVSYFVAGAGEGLVGSHSALPTATIKSYYVPGAGDGLIGGREMDGQ